MQWHAADARLLGQVRFHFRLIRFICLQNGICLYSLLSSRADISPSFCFSTCQVCLHMGYPRGENGRMLPQYFTGESAEFVDNYPEFRLRNG